MNTRILPYLPVHEPPISGAATAKRLDAVALDALPPINAFVRLPIDGEFDDAPAGLRHALDIQPMTPFRYVVEVRRGSGELFPTTREVRQVQMLPGFDPSRPGVLQNGFLRNEGDDRLAEPPKSKGELSLALIAPPAVTR